MTSVIANGIVKCELTVVISHRIRSLDVKLVNVEQSKDVDRSSSVYAVLSLKFIGVYRGQKDMDLPGWTGIRMVI